MNSAEFETLIETIVKNSSIGVLEYKWMLMHVYKMSNDKIREGIDKAIRDSFT